MTDLIEQAVKVVRDGGVIAYPTEYCFGLGCDPMNTKAVRRILRIKNRAAEQGLILIAADLQQVVEYADIEASPITEKILQSWPGPVTWTLPALGHVSDWIKGMHSSIAMRVTGHVLSAAICRQFGHAMVSTSANRHTQAALRSAAEVAAEMGGEIDYIVAADVGGAQRASQIRDGLTGAILR